MAPSTCFYVLVVRFPTGGIRTHLKYFKALAPVQHRELQPVLVCPEGDEGVALAMNLDLPPELNLSKGVRTLGDIARTVLSASHKFSARLIHSHGFTSGAAAAPAALLHRRAHVVSAHDVITQAVLDGTSRVQQAALGLAMRSADAVHAVSNDCAASIRLLPFMAGAKNIVVIPNGINPEQFRNPVRRDIRSELGLSAGTFILGFFGRFMAQKGFRTLVDAIGILGATGRSPMVLAVGSGSFIREDKDYIAAKGLSHNFIFLDPVENPASLIAAVDCVAMPSRWEAFGILAAEVMSLGVPLLASTCIGLREVTANTPARTFPSDDPVALANAIAAEMQNSTRARAEAFAPAALRRFDFTPSAAHIHELLRNACNGSGLSGAAEPPQPS